MHNSTNRRRRRLSAEEEEALRRKQEYEENIQKKYDLLEKEFLKTEQQKNIETNITLSNEIKLKGFLDELIASNNTKIDEIYKLEEQFENIGREENDKFNNWHHRPSMQGSSIHQKSAMNKTVTSSMPFLPKPDPSMLDERIRELEETLAVVEDQLFIEEEIQAKLDYKIDNLIKDNQILQIRNKELEGNVHHAQYRFSDLEKVEFLARAKLVETKNELNNYKENLNDLLSKERELLVSMTSEQKEEAKRLFELRSGMSKTLLRIDENNKLLKNYERELDLLDSKGEAILTKKSGSKYTAEYIEVFKKLEMEYLKADSDGEDENADDKSQQDTGSPSVKSDRQSLNLRITGKRSDRSDHETHHVRRSSFMPSSAGRKGSAQRVPQQNSDRPSSRSVDRKPSGPVSFRFDKDHIFYKVEEFYRSLKHGLPKLTEAILAKYQQLSFQELSIKRNYEDVINLKAKKQSELFKLTNERDVMKQRLADKRQEAKPVDEDASSKERNNNSNAVEGGDPESPGGANFGIAIDSGVIGVGDKLSTVNRLRFELNSEDTFERLTTEHRERQGFMLKVYANLVTLLQKLSSLLNAMAEQSLYGLSPDLERLTNETIKLIKEYNTQKGVVNRRESAPSIRELTTPTSDGKPQLNFLSRFEFFAKKAPEENKHILPKDVNRAILASDELKNLFLSVFENCTGEAEEFVNAVKDDMVVNSLLSLDDIRKFLQRYVTNRGSIQAQAKEALDQLHELNEEGVALLCERFDVLISLYVEFYYKITNNSSEMNQIVSLLDREAKKLSRSHIDSVDIQSQNSLVRRYHQPEFSDFVKNVQHQRILKLEESEEIDPSQKSQNENKMMKRKNASMKRAGSSSEARRYNKDAFNEEDFKSNLTKLTMDTLEKKRGYFYNDLQYEFKSKAQREKEEFLNQLNEKSKVNVLVSEMEHFEQERHAIKQRQAIELEKKRLHDLGLDKEPEKAPLQITLERVVEIKPPADKARMLSNSNLLSQIHLIESTVKSQKINAAVQEPSKDIMRMMEAISPSTHRTRSLQSRGKIEEKKNLQPKKPVITGNISLKNLVSEFGFAPNERKAKSKRTPTSQGGLTFRKGITGLNFSHIENSRLTPSASTSVIRSGVQTPIEGMKWRAPPSRSSNNTTKASESRLPKINQPSKKGSFRSPFSASSSRRGSVELFWKPEIEPFLAGVYSPAFFAGTSERQREERRHSSLLVEEKMF